MATTGNIGTAPNGQQVTTQSATSTYTGDELNFISNDEQQHPGISAEQAETDLRESEYTSYQENTNHLTPEQAEQNLRDAEKRWGDQFNQMVANMFSHRPQDTGLSAEESPSSSTGGSQGA